MSSMIHILAVTDGHKHFSKPIDEYIKRLWKSVRMQYVKPSKKTSIQEIRSHELQLIDGALNTIKDKKVIVLSEKGESISTDVFCKKIQDYEMSYKNIVFVVWGAYGIPMQHLRIQHDLLSFGHATMPHGLALLVLLEQIYRCGMIKKWTKYHH